MNPAMAPGMTLGASYAAGDGYIDPPRNVLAYTAALFTAGVEVFERTAFTGLRDDGRRGRPTVHTSAGDIATERSGAHRRARRWPRSAALPGVRIPAGGARHQVVVTEDHPDLAPDRLPMVFDLASGIYWRPEEGGMMWGMSNPDEQPGVCHEFDWAYYEQMRARMADAACPSPRGSGCGEPGRPPSTTPPTTCRSSARAARRRTSPWAAPSSPSAGGHGMMWGPGVSKAAADLVTCTAAPTSSTSPTSASTASTSTASLGSTPTRSPSPSPRSPRSPPPLR